MNQQEAYRKIEQRLAIMKVLLEAGVIDGDSIKSEAVSNCVNQLIKCSISPNIFSDAEIITAFEGWQNLNRRNMENNDNG